MRIVRLTSHSVRMCWVDLTRYWESTLIEGDSSPRYGSSQQQRPQEINIERRHHPMRYPASRPRLHQWGPAQSVLGRRGSVVVGAKRDRTNKRCVSHVCKVPGRSGGAPGPWSAGYYLSIEWDGRVVPGRKSSVSSGDAAFRNPARRTSPIRLSQGVVSRGIRIPSEAGGAPGRREAGSPARRRPGRLESPLAPSKRR